MGISVNGGPEERMELDEELADKDIRELPWGKKRIRTKSALFNTRKYRPATLGSLYNYLWDCYERGELPSIRFFGAAGHVYLMEVCKKIGVELPPFPTVEQITYRWGKFPD